jgi:L-arabinokinase
MTLVFYTSGHGLGHASRDIEVIQALVRLKPEIRIVIRTSAPRWIFKTPAGNWPVEVDRVEADTGVVQIDGLRLDEDETARRAASFYADFDRRVDEEAAAIARLHAAAVVGDVPPLAFAAAARARVPSIALANFTWDWIYEAYPSFGSLAPGVMDIIRSAYQSATRSLRLPLHGGFQPMARMTKDIPLIARHAGRSRAETRRALGMDQNTVIALASFGGHGVDLPYATIATSTRFSLLVTDHETGNGTGRHRGAHVVGMAWLAERGFRYPDLVAAADVVVSKPGYGIVSECIANQTALLYTDRGRFREQDVFVAEMPRLLRCRHLSQDDLRAGRWEDGVESVLAQTPPPDRIETNGADAAARAILDTADSRPPVVD